MTHLAELLIRWLPRQRWFAGKGLPIDALTVESQHIIVSGDPGLRILIIRVEQRGSGARYQLLLGTRAEGNLGDTLAHALIGFCELEEPGSGKGGAKHAVYEAAHDPELTVDVLDHLAANGDADGLRFRRLYGATVHTGLRSLVMPGEQSNTSLIFGEEHVLKVFRRLWPGRNPDLELHEALVGSPFIARPQGWIEIDLDGDAHPPVPTTLAFLQQYLRSATDGWDLAATSVRDLYGSPDIAPEEAGGDFAGEAARLGEATAAVHRDLARVLPTDVLRPEQLVDLAEGMTQRLQVAATEVPELAPYADALGSAYEELAKLAVPLPVQRIHGDYHLEQVVRTDTGWVLLDFEGEPAVPVEQRQQLASPLRDVAAMLRSFDYAARHQLVGHVREDELRGPARAWAQRNRDAFCDGYASGTGVDPTEHRTVLRAFEYDKAVYEVLYEARHRPSWLAIPLDSIASLADPSTAPGPVPSQQGGRAAASWSPAPQRRNPTTED